MDQKSTYWLTPVEEEAWLKASSGLPYGAVSSFLLFVSLYGTAVMAKRFTSPLMGPQLSVWGRNFVTTLHAAVAVLCGTAFLTRKVIERCDERLFCFWDVLRYASEAELGYVVFEFSFSLTLDNWLQPLSWAENLMLLVMLLVFKFYPSVASFKLLPWWMITNAANLFHTCDYFLTHSNARWNLKFFNLVFLVSSSVFKFLMSALLANTTSSWVMSQQALWTVPLPHNLARLSQLVVYVLPAALWFMVFIAFKQVQGVIVLTNEKLLEYQNAVTARKNSSQRVIKSDNSQKDTKVQQKAGNETRRSKKNKRR